MRFFKLITGQWPESFLGTTNIELTKRLLSSSATFIATFFNICSICWSTKTFSWEDHLNKWGRRFLNRNDRKGIWYPLLCSKWRGLLQVSPSFLKNIGDDSYVETFGTPLEINLWIQDVCVSIFLDWEFPDFAEETELGKFLPPAAAALEKKDPRSLPQALPLCLFSGRGPDRKG